MLGLLGFLFTKEIRLVKESSLIILDYRHILDEILVLFLLDNACVEEIIFRKISSGWLTGSHSSHHCIYIVVAKAG